MLRELALLVIIAPNVSAVSAATVSGRLAYPSEYLPAMTVIARNVETGVLVHIETRANQARYRMDLPAGVWVFFAAPMGESPPPDGRPPLRGAHTVYSQCARNRQLLESGECRTGALLELHLAANQRLDHVDIDDWYLSADMAWSLALDEKELRRPDNYFDAELRFAGFAVAAARFIPKPPNFARAADAAGKFRGELEAAAASGATYAQEVAVARWNCGAACENWALVDLASGHIIWPDAPWQTLRSDFPCAIEPINYRLDSRLLRLHRLDGENIRTQTYLWSNEENRLTPFVEGVAPAADFCAAFVQRSGE